MKPLIYKGEDGSVNIEWIWKNRRFGITLENDPLESGWYFVAKEKGGFGREKLIMDGNILPKEVLEYIHK